MKDRILLLLRNYQPNSPILEGYIAFKLSCYEWDEDYFERIQAVEGWKDTFKANLKRMAQIPSFVLESI